MLAPGIAYDAVETAFIGCVFGASTCGQAALYQLSLTGIPITNVNNNCGMGSTALALGFERMAPGSLGAGKNDAWHDHPGPIAPACAGGGARFA
jgi:sterol carrier protein 2